MVKFIIYGIILAILLRMLSNALNDLNRDIRIATMKASEKNKYNRKIKEEKHIKEKWINDLRNGKTVDIGIQTMQCKNDVFIMGQKKFSVEEIQRLDFACDIVNVKEHTQFYNSYDNYFEHSSEVSMTYKDFLNKMNEDRRYSEPKYSDRSICLL